MEERRKEELEHVIYHTQKMAEERKISDRKYAIKLVEQVVFGLVSLILIAVVGALVALVVR